MARFSKGILGPFSGGVGTVIGGTWKGISYMRSKPLPTNREPSIKQLEQREKFKVMVRFLRTITGLVTVTFKDSAIQMSGFNAAFKYNINSVITGSYPDYEIVFENVLVSRGDLPNGINPAAAMGQGAQILFSWTSNTGTGRAADTDKTVKVVYCPGRNQAIFDFGVGRNTGGDQIAVAAFAGETVHTWLGFIAENAKSIATSVYTGSFTIPG